MKNAFYFTLKALFVLKIFKFLVKKKNSLIKKIRLISKFLMLLRGQQTIAIHILPNISRSKGNPTMKCDNEIRKWTWEIFSLNSYTQHVAEKLFPGPFLKNQNWSYLWMINSLKFYTIYFYYIRSWGLSKYIETKLQTTCFYLV